MTDLAEIERSAALAAQSPPPQPSLRALQLGMGWFAEHSGGLDRYYAELLKQLPDAGVVTRGLVCGSEAVLEQSGGVVRSMIDSDAALPRRLAAVRQAVRRELIDFRPDVVVAHFALYAWPALRSLRDYPLIVHFHGPWSAEGRSEGAGAWSTWARYRMERAVYRRADRLVTLSRAFKEVLVGEFGVDESRIAVVRGGVDLAKFDIAQTRDEAREQLGWPRNRPIVLSVRRLVRRMGLENLIDAIRAVSERVRDVQFLIAGRGPLQTELQYRIDGTGLGRHVQLLGYLPEAQLPLAYRAADITVVPSIALEGFGLVAAESLAAGTPAVVTNVGGLPEVVAPLRASLVARDSSSRALAESIIGSLAGSTDMPSGAECRRYAEQFDWSLVARDIRRDAYEPAMKEIGSRMSSVMEDKVMAATLRPEGAQAVHEPLLKIRPPRGWAALDLRSVWRFRDLLWALAGRDVKLRYKQTALGVAWVVLQPLLAAGIFTFVFGKVAGLSSDGKNYFLFSYAGLLGWNLFNSTVTKSSVCLVGNVQLISKIYFPRLVLPLSTIPAALIDFGVALVMMAVLMVMYRTPAVPAMALMPLWVILMLMLSTGIGFWSAALTVPYRDVQYILPVIMQMLLYASPVAYSISRVPQNLLWVYRLNPLVPLLAGFRWSVLGTARPLWTDVAYSAAVSFAFLLVGAIVFKRMERKFADVI